MKAPPSLRSFFSNNLNYGARLTFKQVASVCDSTVYCRFTSKPAGFNRCYLVATGELGRLKELLLYSRSFGPTLDRHIGILDGRPDIEMRRSCSLVRYIRQRSKVVSKYV